ncbi:MAG: hypothetical protein F6K48_30505 [Okeania sp. SIO3H1]|nr:hypothetical protein [Okeania sp. SIO3H1]
MQIFIKSLTKLVRSLPFLYRTHAELFHSVSLEQVYATILFSLRDRETVGQYLKNWLDYTNKAQAEFDRHPPPFVEKVLKWKLNV